jgi:hypothetical protein
MQSWRNIGLVLAAGALLALGASFVAAGTTVIVQGSGNEVNVGAADCTGGIQGSGAEASETRPVGEFRAAAIDGSFTVSLHCGREPRVQITGDDNIIGHVTTEVVDGTLRVATDEPFCSRLPLRLEIEVQDLQRLQASGANTIGLHDVSGDRLELTLQGSAALRADGRTGELKAAISGSGDLNVDDLAFERLALEVSGAGQVSAAGETREVEARIQGAGGLNTRKLQAEKVRIAIQGTGNAEVYASQRLEAVISGVGNINYYGNPGEVTKNVSGVGSVNRMQ